eukprot:7380285-Prymnesium_polylepis.1
MPFDPKYTLTAAPCAGARLCASSMASRHSCTASRPRSPPARTCQTTSFATTGASRWALAARTDFAACAVFATSTT